ncbi:hypothetical protein [Lacimonas salitolerans]|uniref:Uncharacterized protein n=1 Tax=Lacimonas salitolerans TaxID=1323750 RepID=A0ABW4EM17_9RHOB
MARQRKTVMGVQAAPARVTWQAAALVALAVALPAGLVIEVIW